MKNKVMHFNSSEKFPLNEIINGMDAIKILVYVDNSDKVDSVVILDNKKYEYHFQEKLDIYVIKEPKANGNTDINYWLSFFESLISYKINNNIFNKSFLIDSITKLGNRSNTYINIMDIIQK